MNKIEEILDNAALEGRFCLAEHEVYDVLDSLGLLTPRRLLAVEGEMNRPEARKFVEDLPGDKAVLKVSSYETLHKTESGGVRICAKDQVTQTLEDMTADFPDAQGILICEYAEHPAFALGHELMVGARSDPAYGPVIILGAGGTDAESLACALRPGLMPSIALAEDMSEGGLKEFLHDSWVWKYTSGKVRGSKRIAEDKQISQWLKAFAGAVLKYSDGSGSKWTIEEFEVNPVAVSNGRLMALDGVLRFRKSVKTGRSLPTSCGIRSLMRPKMVAVSGVSEKKMNMGRIILNNIIEAGFPKEKLFILKDNDGPIGGVPCFKSAADLPGKIDMMVVSVPAGSVETVLKDAAGSGNVNGVVLITGGMGEKSGTEKVRDITLSIIKEGKAKNPDFSLNGGNSLGIVSNPSKLNTLFIPKTKLVPPLGGNAHASRTAFISQSGAFVIAMESKMPYFKPEYSVCVGNQMDVSVVDYVRELSKDDGIDVILAYIEGLLAGDGARLVEAVKTAVSSGKRVVVYKAGRTEIGQKAVMGHTASIAGDFAVSRHLLKRAGALFADTFEEFEDHAQMCFCFGRLKPAASGNVFVVSNAGFEAAGIADNIMPKGPLDAAAPDKKLLGRVHGILKEYNLDAIVDVKNPLDITPMACDGAISGIVEAAVSSTEYDAVLVSLVPLTPAMKSIKEEGFKDSAINALGALSRKYGKPVVLCVCSGALYDEYCKIAHDDAVPVFRSADRAVRALSDFMRKP